MAELQDELSRSELMQLGALSPEAAKTPQVQAAQYAGQLRDAIGGPARTRKRCSPRSTAATPRWWPRSSGPTRAHRRDARGRPPRRSQWRRADQALNASGAEQSILETDTELGGLGVGNFDFAFTGGKATVTVRVKYAFTDESAWPTRRVQDALPERRRGEVEEHPLQAARRGQLPDADVPIEVLVVEDTPTTTRSSTSDRRHRREHGSSRSTYPAHDRHVRARVRPRARALRRVRRRAREHHVVAPEPHRGHQPDHGQRHGAPPRYFEHLRQRVQRAAPPGCVYSILPPP